MSDADDLERITALWKEGALTDEEFSAQKQKLLASAPQASTLEKANSRFSGNILGIVGLGWLLMTIVWFIGWYEIITDTPMFIASGLFSCLCAITMIARGQRMAAQGGANSVGLGGVLKRTAIGIVLFVAAVVLMNCAGFVIRLF
jgi:hypothetical protein